MKLNIDHTTHYRYGKEVLHSIQYVRLTPPELPSQHIISWQLDLDGIVNKTIDAFGNTLHVTTIDKPHNELTLRASGEVELIDSEIVSNARDIPPLIFLRSTPLTKMSLPMIEFAENYRQKGRAGLSQMMLDLLARVPYQTGVTHVQTTAADAFGASQGVCQDHSHIFIACCRWLGIPARYVSGYIHSQSEEHIASHAWAEAWINDAWYCFDVSNSIDKPGHHIKLAHGLDYLDACPVRGMRSGGGEEHMHAYALVDLVDNPHNEQPVQQ